MRHGAVLAELERATSERAARVLLVRAPRGTGRTQALEDAARALKEGGVLCTLAPCEALGGESGAPLDLLLRAHLGLAPELSGEALAAALEERAPHADAQGRELLAFVLGFAPAAAQTARLDLRSRWEGAFGELERSLASRGAPWALLLDDAHAADVDTLGFVELLAKTSAAPALVVLSARDDQLARLQPCLAAARAAGRLTEAALALPPREALAARFPPEAVERARGNPLLASLLAPLGPSASPTLDGAAQALATHLQPAQAQVLDLLCLAGGRLPGSALEAVLGEWREAAQRLAELGLVTAATTRRSQGAELAVRFAGLVESRARAVPADLERAQLARLGAWAEAQVTSPADRWPLRAPLVVPLLALAVPAGDVRASLGWELLASGPQPLEVLRKAEAGAVGARRLVLARRIVEEETFQGQPKQALATAAAAQRVPPAATAVPPGWTSRLFEGVEDGLCRWDWLSHEEAQLALEVARVEALGAIATGEDARRGLEALEARLARFTGPRAGALSMRLARTWCWFAAEILADGPLARRVCDAVRARVPREEQERGFYAPAFLRAEQIAHSRGGDPARARQLADGLVEVARARGDVRDECVAWNARALLHLRDGELPKARAGFERSLALARGLGFRRREAIALHNLGLVLCQQGEDEAALSSQRQYLAVSEQIGNLVARAYGPAAMAMVHVARLDAASAEPLIARARRAAEENGWPGLVAWTRLLSGELKLLTAAERGDALQLTQARSELLACADILEERQANWAEELDPAELFVMLAFAWRRSGGEARAQAALASAQRYAAESPVSAAWVAAAHQAFEGRRPDELLATLEAGGHLRVVGLWRRLFPVQG